jgi:hypothetical protein
MNYGEAWTQYLKCEELLKAQHLSTSFHITSNPRELFFNMLKTAQKQEDKGKVIRCATLLLKEDRYQEGILIPFLRDLKSAGTEEGTKAAEGADERIFRILERLYDMNRLKDKLFLLRCAKDAGNAGLSVMLLGSVTPEEWAWIRAEEAPVAEASGAE